MIWTATIILVIVAGAKRKIHWSNFSHETINVKYVTPLMVDLTDFDMSESNDTETVTKTITNLLLKHSYSLSPLAPIATENVNMEFMSDSLMMSKLHVLSAKLPSISGNKINFLSEALCMITIGQNAKIIVWFCVTS